MNFHSSSFANMILQPRINWRPWDIYRPFFLTDFKVQNLKRFFSIFPGLEVFPFGGRSALPKTNSSPPKIMISNRILRISRGLKISGVCC